MASLHTPTALLLISLLYVVLPTVTWVVLFKERSQQVNLWCGSGLLTAVSLALTPVDSGLPVWITWGLSIALFYWVILMRIRVLSVDLGRPVPWRTLATIELVLVLGFETLHFGLGNFTLRAQYHSAVTAGLLVYLSWLAWRVGQAENSVNAKWIGAYSLLAAAYVYRIFVLSSGTNPNLALDGNVGQLIAVVGVLTAVSGHFGYVGLALDRANRREVETVAARAREEERRRLSDQIAHLERQHSISEMSATLAHEFSQPLTTIMTSAQVAQRALHSGQLAPKRAGELLDTIVHSSRRASAILARVRSYIKPSRASREPVDLNLLLRDVADLQAGERTRQGVTLVIAPASALVWAKGDPVALSQVVLNVMRNAMEAMAGQPLRALHASVQAEGDLAVLQITDSGPGMTAEVLARTGTAFFTTKPQGLGLGLTISHTIAAQHGGTLTLASPGPGHGVQARLTLPLLKEGSA